MYELREPVLVEAIHILAPNSSRSPRNFEVTFRLDANCSLLSAIAMIFISSNRYGSQRCCAKSVLCILLLVLVVLVSGFEEYSQEDLEAMTKNQLEAICETRGFKLVNNAEDLTKQDYIEAAQRCLAIEQEM